MSRLRRERDAGDSEFIPALRLLSSNLIRARSMEFYGSFSRVVSEFINLESE